MRLTAAAALWLASAAGMAAASGDEAVVTPMRVGRPDAPLALSVWAQQDYSHLAARPAIAQIFTDVFGEWAAAHPGVQLLVSVMPALEQHKAKLLLAAAAGRLPDIASVDSFWMPLFMAGHHVQPLDDYWPSADRADFLPFTIQTLSDGAGHVYGVWHGTDCRVLYYRKDLVPSPPRTWAELLETGSRIARERKIAGYLYNAGRWEAAVFDHLPMFWAQGGELVDAGGRPVFGEPPHRERMQGVLAFLRDTIRTGASPRSVLANNDYQQLTSAAVAGDVAMFLGGSWQLRDLQTGLAPEEFAKWDMAPIPQKAAGTEATSAISATQRSRTTRRGVTAVGAVEGTVVIQNPFPVFVWRVPERTGPKERSWRKAVTERPGSCWRGCYYPHVLCVKRYLLRVRRAPLTRRRRKP